MKLCHHHFSTRRVPKVRFKKGKCMRSMKVYRVAWWSYKLAMLVVGGIGLSTAMVQAVVVKSPQLIKPELNDKWFARELCSKDFASGTLRITKPGYYFLSENIVFNPNPYAEKKRTDKPECGWFTAVSIEANDVVFDFNTFSIEASIDFLCNDKLKLFSVITLNNQPLDHQMDPYGVLGFKGETEFKTVNNVTIKNGSILRSHDAGIKGYEAKNIFIYDVIISEWENRGIVLPGVQGLWIDTICVSGITDPILFTWERGAALTTIHYLRKIIGMPMCPDDLAKKIAELECIFKTKVPRECSEFPVKAIFIPNGKASADCVSMQNVRICDLKSTPQETVCMRVKETGAILGTVAHDALGHSTKPLYSWNWLDAFDMDGALKPSLLLQCQIMLAQLQEELFPELKGQLIPEGLAQAIEEGDRETFFAIVEPCFGRVRWLQTEMQGMYGIWSAAQCVEFQDITACCMVNTGTCGVTCEDLPVLIDPCEEPAQPMCPEAQRYRGNDIHGIAVHAACGGVIERCFVSGLSSQRGSVTGIGLLDGSSCTVLRDCCVSSLDAASDCNQTAVNTTPDVTGYLIGSVADNNTAERCSAFCLRAPRHACGFSVVASRANSFKDCTSYSIVVDDSMNLDSAQFKYAVGFKSLVSECTLFDHCSCADIYSAGEDAVDKATSLAAGFFFVGNDEDVVDSNGMVLDSLVRCNDGGAGSGVGIGMLHAECTEVLRNELVANRASRSGNGFGVVDFASLKPLTLRADSTAIVLHNTAFNNQLRNYRVSFAEGTLPLATATNANVKALRFANEYDNILVEKEPGFEQKEQCVQSRLEICSY